MYTLYYFPECPFCKKVLEFANVEGIELNLKDATQDDIREELTELSGAGQVPFLVDAENGVNMPESDDIIEYLKSNR